MPLIAQQKIVTVLARNGDANDAARQLEETLKSYPPVRIVAIDVAAVLHVGTRMTAVVEIVPPAPIFGQEKF
jgi:hypothetical protein